MARTLAANLWKLDPPALQIEHGPPSCSQGGEGHCGQKAEDTLSCLSASFEVQPAAALRMTSTDRSCMSPSKLSTVYSYSRIKSKLHAMVCNVLYIFTVATLKKFYTPPKHSLLLHSTPIRPISFLVLKNAKYALQI